MKSPSHSETPKDHVMFNNISLFKWIFLYSKSLNMGNRGQVSCPFNQNTAFPNYVTKSFSTFLAIPVRLRSEFPSSVPMKFLSISMCICVPHPVLRRTSSGGHFETLACINLQSLHKKWLFLHKVSLVLNKSVASAQDKIRICLHPLSLTHSILLFI